MRLFLALPLSGAMRRALVQLQEQLRAEAVSGNFTRPENLHLTLAFIGESRDTEAIRAVMARCAGGAFPLRLAETGRFGDLYWAGVEESEALSGLALGLSEGLRSAGFPIEKRPFVPHITLARQLRLRRTPELRLPAGEMRAERFCLMESRRENGRLLYLPVHTQPLT